MFFFLKGWGGQVWVHEGRADSCGFPLSAPAEGDVAGAISPLLHQWLVKLSAGPGVDAGPAVLTVVLQTGDVGTEEGGELPPAASPLALITHLVIQDVWLHLHLGDKAGDGSLKSPYFQQMYRVEKRKIPQNHKNQIYVVIIMRGNQTQAAVLMFSKPRGLTTEVRENFRRILGEFFGVENEFIIFKFETAGDKS